MPRAFAVAALLVALALPAAARAQEAAPPEGFTWLVLDQLNGLHDDPEDPTNGPPIVTQVPDGVLRPVDINHDGETDWRIDWPEGVAFCGTGGCQTSLYVSGPDGFTRAFDRQTLAFGIRGVGDEVRVEAEVHPGDCPAPAAEGDGTCAYAWSWDEAARALIARPTARGVAVMDGAGASPVDAVRPDGGQAPPHGMPVGVEALWDALRVVCPTDGTDSGVTVIRPVIRRLPDVDGDGVPDWSVVQPAPCGSGRDSGLTRIWRTAADGAATLIYQSGQAARFRTDVSRAPAVLAFSPSYDAEGETCRYVSLHWNDARQSLEE